eukprot:g8774.t2
MAAAGRRWKCGVCSAKAGDLVCGGCVTREAERRRVERAERLGALRNVRAAAAVAVQARGGAVEQDARLQKEAADECRLKDQVREVTKRVAEERIKVASAAFALKHHRDLLAAAESHLFREQTSAVEMKEALLEGLRRHAEDATRTLRQRRWRKVVQLFVLLPVEPSIPPRGEGANGSRTRSRRRSRSPETEPITAAGSGRGGASGEEGGRGKKRGTELSSGAGGAPPVGGEVVSGVSTLVDLPLPNNGDYSQVPPDVLMASLALLARLVSGLASCLGISLPHPLFPAASTRYATISVDSSPRERSSQYPLCPLSKLAEIGVMGSGSSVCNTVGAFDTALDLLRSDVVHLCVEGGTVPVDSLWPAEALLLNLWELQQHAVSELRSLSPMIDVPLPMPRNPPESTGGPSYRHAGGAGEEGGGTSPRTASSGSGNRRRGTSGGVRSRLGYGGAGALPSSSPPPPTQGVRGREEDDEATYEFISGGAVLEEESAGGGRGGGVGGRGGLAFVGIAVSGRGKRGWGAGIKMRIDSIATMSWNAYVDTQLVATGAVCQAGIFGKADMQCYANAGDFQLRAYNTPVTGDDGVEKDTAINEAVDMLGFVTSGTKPGTGWRMNGTKYVVLRELDGPVLYLKRTGGSACFACTNSLVIVGVFDDEACKEHHPSNTAGALACNKAVEDLAEYLRSSGY